MEIRISRPSKRCCASDQDFVHNDEIVSLVRYSEGALVREDYAKSQWDEAYGERAYSVWTTRFHDPQVADQEPEEKYSPLRQLFYGAQGGEDRPSLAVAFLAAQLLRRQKVFRQIKESAETDEGGKLILYVDRIGNRLIEVRDPNFSYAELDAARQRLMEELMALEAPPIPEGTEAPASEDVGDSAQPDDADPDADTVVAQSAGELVTVPAGAGEESIEEPIHE